MFFLDNWRHFLHDCQNPLDINKVKADQLLETLNSVNDAIKFTMEFSDKKIPFLDILIKRDNSGTWTDLCHKPTDTQQCLPYSTFHPKHCLKNIPFVMTRRICAEVENNFHKYFQSKNPKNIWFVKSGVNTLAKNNVICSKNTRLIHAKGNPQNLKEILTKYLIYH